MSELEACVRVLAIASLVAGCGAGLPRLPSQGGPAWIEVTSPHFTLWTDAGSDRAGELIQQLERLRQIVVSVAFARTPDTARSLVIALADDDEFAALSPGADYQAYALSGGAPLWQPMFVLPAYSDRDPEGRAIAHELTHVISFAAVHHQPRWLAEGSAQYFEPVSLDPTNPVAVVGAPPPVRKRPLKYGADPMRFDHLISVGELLRWRGMPTDDRRKYYTAWGLFAFLITTRRQELDTYFDLIDRTDRATQDAGDRAIELWTQAFPSLSLATVDAALRQWLFAFDHTRLQIHTPLRRWDRRERALSEADARAIRGLLHSKLARRRAEQRRDVAAALAADPANTLAWLLHVIKDDGAITVEQARAVTAAHLDDWRAWLLVMLALHRANGAPAEFAAAHVTLCQLAAANAALDLPGGLCDRAPAP